jgi:hypothetical protein
MAKTFKAEFATPEQIATICEKMQTVERVRASDRAWIDVLANGGRPYTPDEVEKFQIQINVNWGGLRKIIQTANSQVNNALIYKDKFFTATSVNGPIEKRERYSTVFTSNINDLLKRGKTGRQHMNLLKSRNAAVTLHGVGPIMWRNAYGLIGRFVPLENLLIPTDTLSDFSNLGQFAINMELTQAEFFDQTHGDHVDKRWNVAACRKILDDLAKPLDNTHTATFADQPEKRIEQFKQNRCYYDSDAASTVKLRFFFYKNPEKGEWYRCVILKEGTSNQPEKKDFIYDGRDTPFAENLSHILHVQFGDNNLCAPLKYHSVRGLGAILYSAEECNNRILCETVQHTLLNLKTFLRIQNPSDRDRPKMLDLSQYSVVEDGVSIIPASERHQIDPRLVEYVQSQLRMIMSEGSTSYVQDVNKQSSQPETATKTNALVQTANVQVSAMLQSLYAQEVFYYEEIVRRALDKKCEEPAVVGFRNKCKKDGIPDELMVVSNWQIDPERVLGGGDQFLANQEANALLSQSQRFDPTSQRTILRKWATTTTRNPAMGDLLVPNDPTKATPGTVAAEDVFGTLMEGIPASIREGIDRTTYVESMIGMLGSKVQMITAIDNMGTPQELLGLKTVEDHIGKNIQILAMDQTMKQRVKIYSDALGKIANLIKGFEQRQGAASKSAVKESVSINYKDAPEDIKRQMEMSAGFQPSQLPVTDPKMVKTQQSMAIKDVQFRQKQQHNDLAFQLEQARKNAAALSDLNAEDLKAKQALIHQNLDKALEAYNQINSPVTNDDMENN